MKSTRECYEALIADNHITDGQSVVFLGKDGQLYSVGIGGNAITKRSFDNPWMWSIVPIKKELSREDIAKAWDEALALTSFSPADESPAFQFLMKALGYDA